MLSPIIILWVEETPTGYFQSVSPVTLVFLYYMSSICLSIQMNLISCDLYVSVYTVCVCVCLRADMTWMVVTGWLVLHNAFISTTHALPQSCHWCRCSFIWHLKTVCACLCMCMCLCMCDYYMSKGCSALVSVEKMCRCALRRQLQWCREEKRVSVRTNDAKSLGFIFSIPYPSPHSLPPAFLPCLIPPMPDLCSSFRCGPETFLILTTNTSAADHWWLNYKSLSESCMSAAAGMIIISV